MPKYKVREGKSVKDIDGTHEGPCVLEMDEVDALPMIENGILEGKAGASAPASSPKDFNQPGLDASKLTGATVTGAPTFQPGTNK